MINDVKLLNMKECSLSRRNVDEMKHDDVIRHQNYYTKKTCWMNQFYSSFLSNDFLGVSSPVAFSSISLSNVLLKPGLLTLNFN